MAVYTTDMLKTAFGDLEQFPILALNEFLKENHTGQKVSFSDAGAGPSGGFHCEAGAAGVSGVS